MDLKDGALVAEAIVVLKDLEDLVNLVVQVHGVQHEYHNALYVILGNACLVSGFASLSSVRFEKSKMHMLEEARETTFWKSLDDMEEKFEDLYKMLANPAGLEDNVVQVLRMAWHFWGMGSILGDQKFWRLGVSAWIEEMNEDSVEVMEELKRRKRGF